MNKNISNNTIDNNNYNYNNIEIKEVLDYMIACEGTDVIITHDNTTSWAVYNAVQYKYKHDYNKLVQLYNNHYFKKYYFALLRLANDIRLSISYNL